MTPASLASLLSAPLPTRRPPSAIPATMWRFLPSPSPVSLGEGNTPLLPITASIALKDEGRNPGGAMLDRVAAILLTTAKAAGHHHLACTGESDAFAAALAVYAAKAGLAASIVLSPHVGHLDHLRASAAGATLLAPGQNTPPHGSLAAEDIALAARLAAHTIACEIAEQMHWKLPETLLIPGATPADLLHFEQSFSFLLQHNWTTASHAPRCIAVHVAPPLHTRDRATARIAAQALQQLSDQVAVIEEDQLCESLTRIARSGWMLSPAAAAGFAAAENLPPAAAPVVLIEPRSALTAAREISQILRIRRYPTRMPVGGIISPQ